MHYISYKWVNNMKINEMKKVTSLLFAFVALIAYIVSVNNETAMVNVSYVESNTIEIVLLNEFNENVPFTISDDSNGDYLTIVNNIVQAMSLSNSPVEGFSGLFPIGLQVNTVEIEDRLMKLDFNEKLNEVNPSLELKIIEAMCYVFTQFEGIDSLIFTINHEPVSKLNGGNITLNQPLKKTLALNNFITINSTFHRSEGFIVAITQQHKTNNYLTFKTIRSNEDIITSLQKYYTRNNSIFINNEVKYKTFNLTLEEDMMIIEMSSEVLTPQKTCDWILLEPILFTIKANFNVSTISVVVEGLEIESVDTKSLKINKI